jgi:hypothetical protein
MNNSLVSLIDDKQNKRKYVFELFTSVNNRYLIVEDNVFDFETQTELGNIWESIDNFKAIFNNTIVDNTEYRIVRESILNLPILENNNTLYGLRDILLEYDFFDDTWVGREMKKAGKGTANFLQTSYDGAKKLGVAIGSGEWSEILGLLQKGVLYAFRKLKDALYSTVGGVVDAILVATGIGKTVQWIPWALVTALDIYQLVNNNWPAEEKSDPTWSKYLTIGFDILGLASTGAVAIGARKALMPMKALASNPSKLAAYLLANPKLKIILQKMVEASSIASNKIKTAYNFIKSKFPAGATFMASVIGYMDNFFTKFSDSITKLINPTNIKKGAIAGAKETGINYGIEKVLNSVTNVQATNLKVLSNFINQFKGNKLSLSEALKVDNILHRGNTFKNEDVAKDVKKILSNLNLNNGFLNKVLKNKLPALDIDLDNKIKKIDLSRFNKEKILPPEVIDAVQAKIFRTVFETNDTLTTEHIKSLYNIEIEKVFRHVEGSVPHSVIFKKLLGIDNLSMKNMFKPKLKNINNVKHRLDMENVLIAKFGKNSKKYKEGLKQFDDFNNIRTITQSETYAADIVSRIINTPEKKNWIIKSFGSVAAFSMFVFKLIKYIVTNPVKSTIVIYTLYKLTTSDYASQLDFVKDIKELYNSVKPSESVETPVNDTEKPRNKSTLQPGQLDE